MQDYSMGSIYREEDSLISYPLRFVSQQLVMRCYSLCLVSKLEYTVIASYVGIGIDYSILLKSRELVGLVSTAWILILRGGYMSLECSVKILCEST